MTVRFGLRAPRVGRRLSAQARRFYEPQKHGQQLGLNHDQKFSPILLSSGCGVRPGHQRCPAASPATLWVARARPLCYELRPRRAPHAPLKRRPRRGRRFCESRYSLSTYNSSPPAESSNELRRVAALRLPGGAADCATLKGRKSNAQSTTKSKTQLTAQISAPCSARRGSKTDYGFRAQRTITAQSPAQFSAPCPPHCGSACAPPHLRRPLGFHLDFADAKRAKSPFRRAGDDFLTGSSFFARLVIVPAGTVLFVNKENQKNFRRMLRILKLPAALTNAAASIFVRALEKSYPKRKPQTLKKRGGTAILR